MKEFRWLLLPVIVLICCRVNAQAKLGITLDSFPVAQVMLLDTMPRTTTINVVNHGNEAFNGSVTLQYTLNGNAYTGDVSGGFLELATFSTSIPVGDSIQKELNIDLDQGNFFTVGTSVVVIWPFSLSALTYDSTFETVQVVDSLTSGLKNTGVANTEVFISQQQLNIEAAANCLRHLRVYNVAGQLLMEQNLSSSMAISMDKFSTGCYLVELTFIDNSQRFYKVVNSALK